MRRLLKGSHKAAATAFVAAAALLLPAATQAGTVPSGFQESVVYSGLTEPTSFAFSPDGRVFVAEKSGIIDVYDNLSDTTPEVFADLTTEVHDFWDRGLLGMALDPQFPAHPYVYVLYTLDAPPGGTAPTWGGLTPSDGCPTPPGPTTDGCVVTGRLAKLTATDNKATAQTNLITDWCQQFPSHSVGDLAFGPDGSLYVSGGEGANFNTADWGQFGSPQVNPCGDPPAGLGGTMTPPTAEGGSLRSQDVRTLADPTGLSGSLLRIDPDTGQGKSGNPLFTNPSADANAKRIVAYGMRNPFRFTLRPGTSEVWVGDVGQGTWEEIDRVSNPTGPKPYNFGWPCYEGNNESSARMPSWDAANLNLCESLYGEGPSAVTAPFFSYKHTDNVVSGETCPTGSSSISGLAFYESGPFPNKYNGALFFSDYSRQCIWAMLPGEDGLPDPNNIQVFDAGAHGALNLTVGPEGSLYFADLWGGKIWRISHAEGNQPPVAVATANPQNGTGPLTVHLSATNSSDPDPGDTLSYAWDLDGDGQFDDSTEAAPTHVYSEPGVHIATVRVSDADGASDTDSVSIQVDNTPPTATITAPISTLTWAVGDQISFSATATDPQQGTLPATAYSWTVIMHHCPSNCHEHTVETVAGKTGGVFAAPDHEFPSWLEFRLTVEDAGGLKDTESVEVHPKTVEIEIQTLPAPGFEVAINDTAGDSPLSATVIKGSNNTIVAPPQTVGGFPYAFGAWSDGGAGAHNIVASHDLSLTAVFGLPATPAIAGVNPAGPANDNEPKLHGSVGSDFPAQVKIYANASCAGAPAAVGTSAQFTEAGVAVPVPSNTATSLSAAATNAAGDSPCSNAISYVEDSIPPAAPTLSTSPPSPAHTISPSVSGSAEDGSTVKIFKSADCASNSLAVTGSASQFAAGLTVTVPANSDTALTATATDAAGNVSGCSSALHYVEASTQPAPPTITSTTPLSPGHEANPKLNGIAEQTSTVRVFASANCEGPVVATGSAAQLAGGLAIAVPSNSTTTLTANATDTTGNVSACSNAISYVEDSTAPAMPTLAATSPSSPANENKPKVSGSAELGSSVRIFKSDSCSGTAAATGNAAQLTSGLAISVVPDDADVPLSATATDAAGNVSGCSSALHYVEDSTAPAAPKVSLATSSPANNNKPKIRGRAEAGSTVRIFTVNSCTGPVLATGSAAQLVAGLAVTVANNSNTTLAARAVDAAGNTSGCSKSVSYLEDSTAPQTKITSGPRLASRPGRGRAGRTRAGFAFVSNDPSAHFRCALDSAPFSPCTSPSIPTKLKPGPHKFSVRAIDAAGNADPTPATRKFAVVKAAKR